ncbi:Putative Outer membrane efflux protein; putative copper resistance protein B [Hyphomicrobium sp. GJ21]|uniref:TolC family protein n=1 Tax=Hyphomicrobium sp. GJ21 TaxID=113574 RepID=UPI000622C077|nr:TolC family protein [Hyphomicrobium sp. GJ21]CEJ88110.1 Putative Outer membrane efflux protein; putative copper resistance protein B [Hyphomicrobium sp. GJ21]
MAITTAAAGLMLGGCAHLSKDGGMTLVADQTGALIGQPALKIRDEADAAQARARVKALLAVPLTPNAAVEIALLNNRALQAAYNDLGVSETEMVETILPPAPSFSFVHLTGAELEIERQVTQNILALLTLPRRREIAEDRFKVAQARAVQATLSTASEARRAYFRAVAAAQSVKVLEQSRASAEAVSELAKKLGETGALPKLEQAREHAFYADVVGDLATARLRQRGERESLNRALGLWGPDLAYRLPDKLPALPSAPRKPTDIEAEAVTSRIDIQIARMELAAMAKEYGLTRATRFINTLEASGVDRDEIKPGERTPRSGYELSFEIPIYDFGETKVRRAEETYMRAVNMLIDKAVNARADARQAYQAYRGSYDIARYYEKTVLPLRQTISEQTLLNYNGMLSDLFGLLTDARDRISANQKAIDAKRDFWIAEVDLHAATVGGGGLAAGGQTANAQSD